MGTSFFIPRCFLFQCVLYSNGYFILYSKVFSIPTLGVVVAIGEKCYAIEGKSESNYIKVYTLQKHI